jgi:hypothetical protein
MDLELKPPAIAGNGAQTKHAKTARAAFLSEAILLFRSPPLTPPLVGGGKFLFFRPQSLKR